MNNNIWVTVLQACETDIDLLFLFSDNGFSDTVTVPYERQTKLLKR